MKASIIEVDGLVPNWVAINVRMFKRTQLEGFPRWTEQLSGSVVAEG